EWLRGDLLAGLSVAAVAVPTGIAYAQLAGFPPVVGLYASILPPVAYFLFGSSRQLIVGPDSATCAMVAATLVPLAADDPARYASLSVALALIVGVMAVAGGLARFGFIANFLSKPILIGFLNGIALSIIISQLGNLFGFAVEGQGFFRRLYGFVSGLGQTHWPTLAVGLSVFILLRILKRAAPKLPAPLFAVLAGIAAVVIFDLSGRGVAVVGAVPRGFPAPALPNVGAGDLGALVLGAVGIVVISYCSAMLTARSFAAKNHYEIDANRDFIALGVANIAAGVSQGFVVSGADSRTAINDATGGKTRLAGVFAAAAMAAVLLFLTDPLAHLPVAALAAVLVSAGGGLFDLGSLRRLYRVSNVEFRHALVAMLGVITIGVLPGILLALGLAILKLLSRASRPHDALLGRLKGVDGFHDIAGQEHVETIPGLIIYRFDSSLLFFNADYFKNRVRSVVAAAGPDVRCFIFDAESAILLDTTAADALEEICVELSGQGIKLAIARAKGQFREMLYRTGLRERIGDTNLYPSVRSAVLDWTARAGAGKVIEVEEAVSPRAKW
ncbi:MAG: SulP family inorganic anion transporter, partial [Pyrinomonadaceae bacterium]